MSVRVDHDAETNTYNLGADIEGVFITFASVPGDSVEGRVASVNAAEQAAAPPTATEPSSATGGTDRPFDPADFTDNGDGSFTRTSDGVRGRFTPSGFEPTTAP
jgi:hypothetical protein